MNRRMSFALVFTLVMLVPVFLFAQMGGQMGGMKGGMKGGAGHKCAALDLTDEQQVKMEKLSLEHRLANIDLRAEQKKLRLAMKEELLKDQPDKKALEKIAKSIAANHEKMQMSRVAHMLDVRKILTPEQWKMFVEHHYAKKGMMGGHKCKDRGGMMGDRGCRMGMKGGMKGDHGCRMERPRDGSCREKDQPAKEE